MFKQEQLEFDDDFTVVLDSLMQAYSNVQKQITVLSSKTQSLYEFKKRQEQREAAAFKTN